MTTPHDWHQFDDTYEVRQVTEESQENQWQIRKIGMPNSLVVLDDVEFDQLRQEGPNPKGLD